jgi:hypothetical protein
MSVADTLSKAADLIKQRGLAVGAFTYGERLCALQALWTATGATGSVSAASRAVTEGRATLAQHNAYRDAAITLQRAVGLVVAWSDTTEQDEVVATLRQVADEQRAELVRLGRG